MNRRIPIRSMCRITILPLSTEDGLTRTIRHTISGIPDTSPADSSRLDSHLALDGHSGNWGSGGNYWGGGVNWNNNNININRPRVNPLNGNNWQHRPEHRQGVRYNNPRVEQRFGNNNLRGGAQNRMDFRGRRRRTGPVRAKGLAAGQRPGAGQRPAGGRPSAGQRPSGGRPSAGQRPSRRTRRRQCSREYRIRPR